MGPQTDAQADLRAAAGSWWVFALVGALSAVAGVIVLAKPSISLATLAVIGGIFLLLDGLFELIWSLVGTHENRALVAIFGVISAIVGVVLIRHPTHAVVAIALLFGLWLLIAGVLRLIRASSEPSASIWPILLGLLELVAGIVIVATPDIGVATLALLIGISWVVRGVAMMIAGWALRTVGHAASDELPGSAPAAT